MAEFRLVMLAKNYSSWSVRPWLVMKQAGIPFEEITVPYHSPAFDEEIIKYSPTGKVPILLHGDRTVWVSLAICEYIAELAPEAHLWPEDREARAHARSVSAEMLTEFPRLRESMPMNARARKPGKGMNPGVPEEIRRIQAIWNECRERYADLGPMLFGNFTIADAMFAPVVSRFITYDVPLDPVSAAYVEEVWDLPIVEEWQAAAAAETERIEAYEL